MSLSMKCRIAGLAGLLLSPLAQADFSIPGFELVHTVPLDTDLASADLRQPGPVWIELFDGAKSTIDIGQFLCRRPSRLGTGAGDRAPGSRR